MYLVVGAGGERGKPAISSGIQVKVPKAVLGPQLVEQFPTLAVSKGCFVLYLD